MKLRVSSIDPSLDKTLIKDLFSDFGEVNTIKIFRGVMESAPPSLVFVEMTNDLEAKDAIDSLNGTVIGKTRLCVEVSQDSIKAKKMKPVISLDDDEDDLDPTLAEALETADKKKAFEKERKELDEEADLEMKIEKQQAQKEKEEFKDTNLEED